MISISVPGLLYDHWSASNGLQVARYNFWCKNWKPDPYKPTFRHTIKHIGVWPPGSASMGLQVNKYFFSVWEWNPSPQKPTSRHTWSDKQDQTPGSASSPGGLTLLWYEKWNLDLYKTTFRHTWRQIRMWALCLYLAGLQNQPLAASSGLQVHRFYICFQN